MQIPEYSGHPCRHIASLSYKLRATRRKGVGVRGVIRDKVIRDNPRPAERRQSIGRALNPPR